MQEFHKKLAAAGKALRDADLGGFVAAHWFRERRAKSRLQEGNRLQVRPHL